MDLALKIMLSGWNGPFVEDVEITNILATDTLYFESRNLVDEFGLTAGDYITTTGASNGANNVTLKVITTVDYDDTSNSTTLTVAGVTFVEEEGTAAVVDFRSRYDTLPSGLRMSPDEVDVDEHERLKSVFLTSVNYEFYLKSTIENGKDFLNSEVYQPIACYSVPKNTRASVGYTAPPPPGLSTPPEPPPPPPPPPPQPKRITQFVANSAASGAIHDPLAVKVATLNFLSISQLMLAPSFENKLSAVGLFADTSSVRTVLCVGAMSAINYLLRSCSKVSHRHQNRHFHL